MTKKSISLLFILSLLVNGLFSLSSPNNACAQEDNDPVRQAFIEELDVNYQVLVTRYHTLGNEIAQLRIQEPLDRARIRAIKMDRKAIRGLGINLYRAKQCFGGPDTDDANSNIYVYNAASKRFRTVYNFKYIIVPDEMKDETEYWNSPEGHYRKTLFDQEMELGAERGQVRQALRRQQENLNQFQQQYLRFQEQIIASFDESLSEIFSEMTDENIHGKRWAPLGKLPSIEITSEGPPQVTPPREREIEPLPELSDEFKDLLRKFRIGRLDGWEFVSQLEEIMSEEMQAIRRYQGQTGYDNRIYEVKRTLIDWDYSQQWHQDRVRVLSNQFERLDARIQAIDAEQDQYRNTDLPPNIDQDFPPDRAEEPDEDEPKDKKKSRKKKKTYKRKPVKVTYVDCSLKLINDISARHAALSRMWTRVSLQGAKILQGGGDFQTAIVAFTEMLGTIRQLIADLKGTIRHVRVCSNKQKVIDTINNYNDWVATVDQRLYEDYEIDPIGHGVIPPEKVPEEPTTGEDDGERDDWEGPRDEAREAEERRRMEQWDNAPVYDKEGNIVKRGSELSPDDMYYYKLVIDEETGEVSWHAKTNQELDITDTQRSINNTEFDLRHNQWRQNETKFKLREERERLGLPEYDVRRSSEMVDKIKQRLERLRGGIPTDEVNREIKRNERWLGEWEEKLKFDQAELQRSQEYIESLEKERTWAENEQGNLEQGLEKLQKRLSGLSDGT